jgi:hypothetical protein
MSAFAPRRIDANFAPRRSIHDADFAAVEKRVLKDAITAIEAQTEPEDQGVVNILAAYDAAGRKLHLGCGCDSCREAHEERRQIRKNIARAYKRSANARRLPRPVRHVERLIGELKKWAGNRQRKGLDVEPLEAAVLYLEEYRRVLPLLRKMYDAGLDVPGIR